MYIYRLLTHESVKCAYALRESKCIIVMCMHGNTFNTEDVHEKLNVGKVVRDIEHFMMLTEPGWSKNIRIKVLWEKTVKVLSERVVIWDPAWHRSKVAKVRVVRRVVGKQPPQRQSLLWRWLRHAGPADD